MNDVRGASLVLQNGENPASSIQTDCPFLGAITPSANEGGAKP
ncbi:hypothetical protein [Roseovarius indicus]|nr:hypothetical protein [Roseovarius indicus]